MNRWLVLLSIAALLLGCTTAPRQLISSGASLSEIATWLEGEWNNNEQVWQQAQDAKAGRPTARAQRHVHTLVARIEAPQLGTHVYYVRENFAPDPSQRYRQRVYRLTDVGGSIRMSLYALADPLANADLHLHPERARALESSALRTVPGCELSWSRRTDAARYDGRIDPNTCRFQARDGQQLSVTASVSLSPELLTWHEVTLGPDQVALPGDLGDLPLQSRKVRYFDGWAVLNRHGVAAQSGDDDYLIVRPIRLHSEGQVLELKWEDGRSTGYAIELARLTYQSSGTPILKLALIDQRDGRSFAYTWGDPGGRRIGINLGWIQAGFTEKPTEPAIGWR